MALGIVTHNIMASSIATFIQITLSIIKIRITTLSIIILSIATLSITTLSIMTHSKVTHSKVAIDISTLSIKDTLRYSKIFYCCAEYYYAECR